MDATLGFDVRPATRAGSPRLVMIHGFTQTRRSWDRVRDALAGRYETLAVDAPGHGESSGTALDLTATAAALARTGGRATYIGYSMGGRMALHTALDHRDAVQRLVLVSATAGIDDPTERATRRAADDERAAAIERDGVAAFLDRWLALPMFATLPPEAAGRAEREVNTAAGLAASLRAAGTGTQRPLWGRLPELDLPVLLVAGALDTKFVAAAQRMASLLPSAELHIAPHAGHTVHLEQPAWFGDLLGRWLARTDPGER
jgi:2-succinyl-6-hydroxy-2,4-cyclohexadiene-1-carboxylate synthase